MRAEFLDALVDEADKLDQAIEEHILGPAPEKPYLFSNALHLRFADWLEENGEPDQAKLIRVACELVSIPPFDGLVISQPFTISANKDEVKIHSRISEIDLTRYRYDLPRLVGEIGRLARECTIRIRFGEYEGVAFMARSNYDTRIRMVEVEFQLIPSIQDNRVATYWINQDKVKEIRLRNRQQKLLAKDFAIAYPLDTWECGLVVRWTCNSESMVRYVPKLMEKFPIRTVELTDWLGIQHSLPSEPSRALPWLRKLTIPRLSWHPLGPTREIEKLFDGKVAVKIKEMSSASGFGFGYSGEEGVDVSELRAALGLPEPTAPDTSR